MKTKSTKPIVYLVVALMLATSITYLIVAVEESSEISSSGSDNNENAVSNTSNNENDNSNERPASNTESGEKTVTAEAGEILPAQIETTLFAAASAGYLAVGVWMLKKKENTKIPYVMAIVGSLSLIVLYVVSRMVSLPIVGLQEDIGSVDIMSKILQVGIIAVCLYILMSFRRSIARGVTTIPSR